MTRPSNYHELGVDGDGTPHILFGRKPDLHKADPECGCNPDWYHDDTPGDSGWWSHHEGWLAPVLKDEDE